MTELESRLADLLGADALVADPAARGRYLTEWLGSTRGQADAIVRPASTQQVAHCVAWCVQQGIGVVPQGGHTGLAGGATPLASAGQVVLSLEQLNQVREIDPIGNTITVGAGAILQQVQEAADAQDRLFPLSLGAEGSCQIGGCIASNAGGTAVLRYGNTRELVLGLEVVLPDGTIWNRLKVLRKDNAGFDLKHLFIGTEGTLGIITAATLRLFPKPRQRFVALVAVPGEQAVLDLFVRVRGAFDAELTAFEFMTGQAMALACSHLGRSLPLGAQAPFVVLLELCSPHPGDSLSEALLPCLEQASEAGTVLDAALASNEQQAAFFWNLRETVPEAMLRRHPQVSAHDISLPIARIPEFMRQSQALVAARWPALSTLVFGHVGDGNLHFNLLASEPLEPGVFKRAVAEAVDAIYELTDHFAGSISAEHGIGTHKKAMLQRFAPAAHQDLMRTLKHALDRPGLLNPGKVFA